MGWIYLNKLPPKHVSTNAILPLVWAHSVDALESLPWQWLCVHQCVACSQPSQWAVGSQVHRSEKPEKTAVITFNNAETTSWRYMLKTELKTIKIYKTIKINQSKLPTNSVCYHLQCKWVMYTWHPVPWCSVVCQGCINLFIFKSHT